MRKLLFTLLICLGTLSANPLDPVIRSQITVHQYYSKMIDYYQKEDWRRLAWQCQDLIADFPTSPFARESLYYLGVAHMNMSNFAFANQAFSDYLKEELNPKFFDQVIRYKFEIARAFDGGARTHLFGWHRLPKWLPAYEGAIEIYDEVITTLPRDDLTAQSLFYKGALLLRMEEYTKSVESFQTLIRRFPKHPLAVDGYIGVGHAYLTECKQEFPDANKLELAEISLRKFRYHFPSEPRIEEAEGMVLKMKEELAKDLLEIAEFYERTKKPKAAKIYHDTILKRYPETKVALKSEKRLKTLNAKMDAN